MTDPVVSTVDNVTLDKVLQAVLQAAQAASQASQAANQTAQQIGEQVSQGISQGMQKFFQTTGAATVVGKSEMGDIGGTERLEKDQMSDSGILFANQKRTFDEYQDAGLTLIKQNQRVFEQAATSLQAQLAAINNLTTQHLQNAITATHVLNSKVAENVGKSGDVATDALWNPVQQGAGDTLTARAVTLDDASLKAIGAMIANIMSQVQPKVGA